MHKLEEEATKDAEANGKKNSEFDIYYTILASHGSDDELVRKHLDSDVLTKLLAEKETAMLSVGPKDYPYPDPGYIFVLLGACAMTLGCKIPENYKETMKKVYMCVGFMDEALKQIEKALNGPNAYKDGEPYIFEPLGLHDDEVSQDPRRLHLHERPITGWDVRLCAQGFYKWSERA